MYSGAAGNGPAHRPSTAGTRRTPMQSSGETISVFNMFAMGAAIANEESTGGSPTHAVSNGQLSASSSSSSIAPPISYALDSNVRRERKEIITSDSLLRIMTDNAAFTHNEVIGMAERGNLARIVDLVDQGFDWQSCRGLNGYTPLHYACSRGHLAVAVELLRGCPSMVHTTNDEGETALHVVCFNGTHNSSLLLMHMLLDRGSCIDATNLLGETPLSYAARKSLPAAVRLLLQRGADPGSVDKYGESPVDYADDEPTRRAFSCEELKPGVMPLIVISRVLSFLTAAAACRTAAVSTQWHAATESASLCLIVGSRRWERAVHAQLGRVTLRRGSKTHSAVHLAVLESRTQEQEKARNES